METEKKGEEKGAGEVVVVRRNEEQFTAEERQTHLGASDHCCIAESEVKDGLTVVDQSIQHLSTAHIPHSAINDTVIHSLPPLTPLHTHTTNVSPNGGVTGASDNNLLVILQAEDGARMTLQHSLALQRFPVPYLHTTTTWEEVRHGNMYIHKLCGLTTDWWEPRVCDTHRKWYTCRSISESEHSTGS